MTDPDQSSPLPDQRDGDQSDTKPRATADAMQAFAELGAIKLAGTDLHQVLARVAELAKAAIPGAAEVSVTLVLGGTAETAAFTGELALALDEKQYETGFGPCLDAAATNTTRLIADMATDGRWPGFAAKAVQRGALASLSVGIPIEETITGALNIYAIEPNAFDEDAVELAKTFAGYAAVAMANAHLYSTTAALAQQMAAAMESRAVIEQAKGILVAQQHIDPDAAFDLLSRASQTSNRKLRDIAQGIVDAAHLGRPGPDAAPA